MSIRKSVTLLAALLTLAACQRQPSFTVEGTVEDAADSTLYLYNRSMSGIVLLDSARLAADGRFSFSQPAPVGGPDLYVLRLGGQFINFAVDSTETITISARYPQMAQGYTVGGSASSEKIRQLALRHSQLQQRVYAVERDMRLMGEQMVDSLQTMLRQYKDSLMQDYIFPEPQSAQAYFALSETLGHLYWAQSLIFVLGDSLDDRAYRAVATCWKEFYPESERAQQLYNMVERDITNNRIVSARRQRMAEEDRVVVSDIIDLSLPDLSGRQRTLSELSGKVVLLDFHLFSAPESAARILRLRELYDRYHDRGLEIYQVSIDQDEHLWRQAVEALPWVAVWDPQAIACQRYNVQALPEFFTIDRHNALQKRSSQIEDLDAELEALLR